MLIEKLEQLHREISQLDTALITTLLSDNIELHYPSNYEIRKMYKMSNKTLEDLANHFFIAEETAKNYIYGKQLKNKYRKIEIIEYLKQ